MAVQIVGSMLFVGAGGLLMWRMRTILSATATDVVCLACAIAAFALMLVIPDRYAAYRDPSTSLLDRGWLQIFEKLLAAARTASPFAAERLRTAIARWLHDERFPDAVLPDPHGTWTLAPLLTLVRLARETGETAVLHGWRDRLERSLRQIVTIDGVGVAPGQPPSLYWSTLAAAVIDEAELRDAFPFERMLAHRSFLLEDRPYFVDFDLYGMLGDFLYAGHYELPAPHTQLKLWYEQMARIQCPTSEREKLHP
jgi:glutathione S-transferase